MDVVIADVVGDVALVLVLASLLGAAARLCGQPRVVGQILSGILLGPSVLGRLPGDLTHRLFPAAVLPSLTVMAQFAVVIFMFVVGYEIDLAAPGRRRAAIPLVASAALLVPFGLGSGAVLIFRSRFAALGQASITSSLVLFMGVALAITALPVLAAIARERGLAGSTAGVVATAAAGLMDVAAWLALAAVLSGAVHRPGRPWPVTLLLLSGFAALMLSALRPGLRWLLSRRGPALSSPLPVALALALGSAWVTASLGLHPIFGGFLAGLVMPRAGTGPDADIIRPLDELGGLLLPLFFVVTGLSVTITALDANALIVLAILCLAASAGKVVPGYAAGRVAGLGRADSAIVAALINARGLTELIALNVGLTAGVIDDNLFTVLVLVALITTMSTTPGLALIRAAARSGESRQAAPLPPAAQEIRPGRRADGGDGG